MAVDRIAIAPTVGMEADGCFMHSHLSSADCGREVSMLNCWGWLSPSHPPQHLLRDIACTSVRHHILQGHQYQVV